MRASRTAYVQAVCLCESGRGHVIREYVGRRRGEQGVGRWDGLGWDSGEETSQRVFAAGRFGARKSEARQREADSGTAAGQGCSLRMLALWRPVCVRVRSSCYRAVVASASPSARPSPGSRAKKSHSHAPRQRPLSLFGPPRRLSRPRRRPRRGRWRTGGGRGCIYTQRSKRRPRRLSRLILPARPDLDRRSSSSSTLPSNPPSRSTPPSVLWPPPNALPPSSPSAPTVGLRPSGVALA
ncbi:hypothetical protein C8Q76DRAFT_751184 [Earliella scabrosa]|nr:hypothetical protein C8Q76DRAFT_751184 [Earliella scabrosa]